MFIYKNGELIKKEDVTISPFDHGFLYGIGLFETIRVYEHHPFLLDDHLERLNRGLKALNINAQYTRREINDAIQVVLTENGFENANIRINVSAGIGEIGLQTDAYPQPNLLIFSRPLPPAGRMAEKKAVLLKLARNTPEGSERLKSHHFLNNMLARRELGDDHDVEGIFLTDKGYLAEGIVSNLFWFIGDTLFTPSLQTGILNGITRQYILRLADTLGYKTEEGFFRPGDAEKAEEMFITNSIQEIVPLSSFNGKRLIGSDGQLVSLLHQEYRNGCQSLWSRKELG
ncbi:4-amino-4-deoxychorismate lyase [Bacillus sp. V3-13]|uniref:aminodeoxychorismate lyase n=1 Tax=Bacillus sp. V3-13 TaxID=2053728 RepID=UPI000C782BA2|nr:aminodeoxychorismate lyase [Bacillus sp. V3-13]PLR78915.1 4-amino-4-deoxychorismate lyase [Bacillus sp. V3-13]